MEAVCSRFAPVMNASTQDLSGISSGLRSTIIVESGSTKADWVCVNGPAEGWRVQTSGYNPSYLGSQQLLQLLKTDVAPLLPVGNGLSIIFYGAGCAGLAPKKRISEALLALPNVAEVVIEHDLLAAARGLFGNEKGLVAILGTGSHACVYDGKDIGQEAVSLGYLMGDEGGGVQIGKRLVQAFFYGTMPVELHEKFHTYLQGNGEGQSEADLRENVIEQMYRQPFPNRWLAGLTRFITQQPGEEWLRKLVVDCFSEFTLRHIMPLISAHSGMPIAATGSIAHLFEPELSTVLVTYGLHLRAVAKSPMEGLIRYHKQISVI
jgi:glucosamine kinase